ncbi:glycosyltransferase family 4 protein [Desertivirga xinjiangensis]|uniref:glycosyltransferase family 4 protein n=1 Tax=Desertivirga xinjiangensis TaxID=539206 RepID=UPI002108D4DD|nr:glycosyltransferase family 4 protein [Pedobacter xinjiangensis]
MIKKPKILFITLKTFSLTGGVETVCRSLGYAFQQMHDSGEIIFSMYSLYDTEVNEKYVRKGCFTGLGGKKGRAILHSIKKGIQSDTVILSHINLAPIGLAIKLASPSTRLIIWTHGIEIWRPLNALKKALLKRSDDVIAVSQFTAKETEKLHDVGKKNVKVIANALDPFFSPPDLTYVQSEPEQQLIDTLKKKYFIKPHAKIFLALTRLKGTEKNKNYDKVIRLLGELKKEGVDINYILCGKYDEEEYIRIKTIAEECAMEDNVHLTGFIPDNELQSHYQMADAFVLPSTKEGFGLAFIEAQACGLPVLAGNLDGSTEAVKSAIAGVLINPYDTSALKSSLRMLANQDSSQSVKQMIQKQCLEHFSFSLYKEKIKELLFSAN